MQSTKNPGTAMKSLLALILLIWPLATSAAIPADTTVQPVRVVVDPRIELMAVVQLLNDYLLITEYDFIYKRDARAYFSRFQDHPAVKIFGEMSQVDFSFDAVPKAMLALTDPPELELRVPFSDYVVKRAGGESQLNRFVEALRDFAQQSQFQTFFEAHEGTFKEVIDNTRSVVEDAVAVLRGYSGMDLAGSTVVLGMLLHHGGFAAMIEHEIGDVEAYALIGPVGGQNGLPTFGSASHIESTTWHEFSHTFINPLTDQYANSITKYAALYKPISEQMGRQAYPDWQITVNEHIIRAITIRLAYIEVGAAAGDHALEREKNIGFAYVEALAAELKEYETARDQYPTIADFYPQLIEVFREASEEIGK